MAFLVGPETLLTGAVRRAARHTARGLPQDFSITVEQPENSVYGDYATNIALRSRRCPIRRERDSCWWRALSKARCARRRAPRRNWR